VAHDLVEEQIGDWRKANRGTRVAIANLFHGVGG
jgi:hypothetical protein